MRNNMKIDLTPLLDVMMIIIFAVLMSIQKEHMDMKQSSKDYSKSLESLSKENQSLYEKNKDLERILSQYNRYLSQFITDEDENISLNNPEAFKEEILKYNSIKPKFSFIDIELKTKDNNLYINQQKTNIYIFFEQVSKEESRTSLKRSIQEAIEAQLQVEKGSTPLYLISLKDDGTVYRYAYTLVWEVIKDIEKKYGSDRIFKLEVY